MVVERDGSPVVAVPLAARGALDERFLVGTDVSDLSTLAGARAGTDGVTLRMKNTKLSTKPSKPGARRENATYLRFEKPRFLFLEGSVGVALDGEIPST
jgi:hypothetical protein